MKPACGLKLKVARTQDTNSAEQTRLKKLLPSPQVTTFPPPSLPDCPTQRKTVSHFERPLVYVKSLI